MRRAQLGQASPRVWRQTGLSVQLFDGLEAAFSVRAVARILSRQGYDALFYCRVEGHCSKRCAIGFPVYDTTKLQHQLGHKDIRTTMRYLHWLPNYRGGDDGTDLIADLERTHERRG